MILSVRHRLATELNETMLKIAERLKDIQRNQNSGTRIGNIGQD